MVLAGLVEVGVEDQHVVAEAAVASDPDRLLGADAHAAIQHRAVTDHQLPAAQGRELDRHRMTPQSDT